MNNYHHINTQAELEQLIDRYYDGETSVQEEQELRQCLADCPWSSEVIDGARFTMGYYAAHTSQQQRAKRRSNRLRMTGIAATIAIILGIGAFTLWHQQQPGDVCIAYVNGQIVQENEQVMAMIADDLEKMDNAADAMTNQLSSLGEAIELDNQ